MSRDLDAQRSSYRKYSDSLEQARIDEALDMQRISNIGIVETATYTVKPVRPKVLLNLALGFFLAIFGALGLAFFTEFQDDSLKKPEDVANRLRLPVLAALPIALPEKASSGLAFAESGSLPVNVGCELLLGTDEYSAAIGDLLRFCGRGLVRPPVPSRWSAAARVKVLVRPLRSLPGNLQRAARAGFCLSMPIAPALVST